MRHDQGCCYKNDSINCVSFFVYSETVDYQTVYSGGNGEVYALGVVSHSHIAIVAYSLEDGEIIKQVILFYSCSVKIIGISLNI